MNEKPLVSIITVTKNSAGTISRAIEAVLGQTYDRVQYIIVDGVSDDATVSIAESYREAFAARGFDYTIVSEPDRGIYDAMNKGIDRTDGDIVGICNSDDWYERDTAENVVNFYNETHFDLMRAMARVHREDGSSYISSAPKKYSRRIVSTEFSHPSMFVTRALYNKYHYDLRYPHYADFALWLVLRRAGYETKILRRVVTNFSLGGVSTETGKGKGKSRYREKYSIYRDNGMSRFYAVDCFVTEYGKSSPVVSSLYRLYKTVRGKGRK